MITIYLYLAFKTMMNTLTKNGLANTDIKGGDDNTTFMYSSINSALSAIYQNITPAQVSGGGSVSYINPQNIQNSLQKIYSFGSSSGSFPSGQEIIGKQYDLLTQIQQLGVHMVGDVVDNLYQIGDAYTNTFNINSALISGNMTDSMDQLSAIRSFQHDSMYKDRDARAYEVWQVPEQLENRVSALQYTQTAFNAAAIVASPVQALSSSTYFGTGPGQLDLTGVSRGLAQAAGSAAAIFQQKIVQDALDDQSVKQQEQLRLLKDGMQVNYMMMGVQHKQLELAKMSYQMMVNMTKAMMLLPLAFIVLTMLFTSGIQFALIIPMTPYIIFWAGQTSWLINTIEAMIAAPLVALALLHPGGHAYYGHSVQAYKMLLNVVLKPVLLVFGTLASMILVYIIVVYSAQGFHMMANSVVGTFLTFNYGQNADGTYQSWDRVTNVRAILSLMLIFMYATFLTMVFNKCFSVIYLIPEKVVQWIGGQSDNFGKEAAQHLAQATQQESTQVAQAGQSSTSSMAGGSKDMSSAKGSSAQQQVGSGVQMSEKGSQNMQSQGQESSNAQAQGDTARAQQDSSYQEQSSISDSMKGQDKGMVGSKKDDD